MSKNQILKCPDFSKELDTVARQNPNVRITDSTEIGTYLVWILNINLIQKLKVIIRISDSKKLDCYIYIF